jgi:hypothetical protein
MPVYQRSPTGFCQGLAGASQREVSHAEKTLPSDNPAPVPRTPSAGTASEGIETTRALARRYLPDAVNLLAGIAFGHVSEAARRAQQAS